MQGKTSMVSILENSFCYNICNQIAKISMQPNLFQANHISLPITISPAFSLNMKLTSGIQLAKLIQVENYPEKVTSVVPYSKIIFKVIWAKL